MPKSTKKQLRALWLQVHKWIGLLLAVLIIPISVTGAALVWHDWLEAQLDPQRHQVLGPAGLPPSAYAAAAATVLEPGERLTALRFSPEGEPVIAVASKPAMGGGRPERINTWLDPRDATVIERASASDGPVRVMHVIHGSMMIPGGWGRPLVGWVGVFMFVSCLTGIWLWWPLSGGFASGFKWKRRNTVNANLHYLTGFWILLPLAMLSLTGAWISFPSVFSAFESAPLRGPGGPGGGRGGPAPPLDATRTTVDAAVAAAAPLATGALLGVSWPTEREASWTIQFEAEGAPAEVKIADADAVATPPPPPQPETLARTMRRWHDGTDMGLVWQVVIFLGGIVPALLSVTGLIIWWRARRARRRSRATMTPAAA
ncbi:MAG TPA: PepSY-associated TM helix domain-containing protein [Croceibacterium sp.]|nr:PepSY-associated TM helix domain-containing protein [Croceibacterium sp.]